MYGQSHLHLLDATENGCVAWYNFCTEFKIILILCNIILLPSSQSTKWRCCLRCLMMRIALIEVNKFSILIWIVNICNLSEHKSFLFSFMLVSRCILAGWGFVVDSWGLLGIFSFTLMCVLFMYFAFLQIFFIWTAFASAICNASLCYLSGSREEGGFFHWLGEHGPDVHIGAGCDSCGVNFWILPFFCMHWMPVVIVPLVVVYGKN